MKILLSQTNSTVGDLRGNLDLIKGEILFGHEAECDVILLPELVTTGYPPRDLLYQQWIWDQHEKIARDVLNTIRGLKRQMTVIFGGLHQVCQSYGVKERYNAAYIVDPHFGIRFTHKRLLPQYDVFDESRYFKSAIGEPYMPIVIAIGSKQKGKLYFEQCDVLICEDIWNNRYMGDRRLMPAAYTHDPIQHLTGTGPLFVLNGSPYWDGKVQQTRSLVEEICFRIQRPVCWVNQVGAHDDIVTGGYSMVTIPDKSACTVTRMAKAFVSDRLLVRLAGGESHHDCLNLDYAPVGSKPPAPWNKPEFMTGVPIEAEDFNTWCSYEAAILFIRNYMSRCGFKKAVLGLSGGIDSALVAYLAAKAIGPANVIGISMPSKYSSEHSVSDAEVLAKNIGLDYRTIPIGDLHEAVRGKFLTGGQQNFHYSLTDENIQPRLRALILMTVSNDEGALLLTTGNKSEVTVGYCTLYGDTCGGIAPLVDMWKTDVFAMCKFINKYAAGIVIPESTINKPPSAELRADQKDTDSLPPYDELDPILKMVVEQDMTPVEIGASLLSSVPPWFMDMYRKYKLSEYKRWQMPPGAKLKQRSFGSGRRMPVAAKESRL